VLNPEVLDVLKHGEHCGMTKLFDHLQDSGARTIVYPMHEPWLDVGHVDNLKRAQANPSPKAQP
jgi:NDP-sugar pyrophosphorylase family protein